jgi:hypothetical protein
MKNTRSISITDRLSLLNEGRRHYLEFLRNLTPQGVLFAMTLFVATKLDLTRFEWKNPALALTLIFIVFLASFLLSVYANTTNFYQEAFSKSIVWYKDQDVLIKNKGVNYWQHALEMLKAIWQNQLVEVIEIIAVFVFLIVTCAMVIILSVQSAAGILETFKPQPVSQLITK